MAGDVQKCERLPLSTGTKRRLWSESGGYCQNPDCAIFLFNHDADVDFAEMAHIVPATTAGPRDEPDIELTAHERAQHYNIAVLCANCHTTVDKAPSNYSISTLKRWKLDHQEKLDLALGTPRFTSRQQARDYVAPLMEQNHAVFTSYGPTRDAFSEPRAALWRSHVAKTVIKNNGTIVRALKRNRNHLSEHEHIISALFELHAQEFEARHLLRDWNAGTQKFPEGMTRIFEGDE